MKKVAYALFFMTLFSLHAHAEAPLFDATFIESNLNYELEPGENFLAEFTFKNTGKNSWETIRGENPVFLGIKEVSDEADFSNSFQNWGWSNERLIKLSEKKTSIKGDQIAVFSAYFKAPDQERNYHIKLQPIVKGDDFSDFFGEEVVFDINVKSSLIGEATEDATVDFTVFEDTEPVKTSAEVQRIYQAKNEITEKERTFEQKIEKLEENLNIIEEKIEKTDSKKEKILIGQELKHIQKQKDMMYQKMEELQNKIEKNQEILSANIQKSIDHKSIDSEKKIMWIFIGVFTLSFVFVHLFVTKRFFKNAEEKEKTS
ncbi:MAG: hypothetical protein N4A36_04450 [Candidatus Gracilibacteria bacterium]|jgi:hypothetical protein|nr:hypothetical protein [Candidatus Gracilibacteria bacterium]